MLSLFSRLQKLAGQGIHVGTAEAFVNRLQQLAGQGNSVDSFMKMKSLEIQDTIGAVLSDVDGAVLPDDAIGTVLPDDVIAMQLDDDYESIVMDDFHHEGFYYENDLEETNAISIIPVYNEYKHKDPYNEYKHKDSAGVYIGDGFNPGHEHEQVPELAEPCFERADNSYVSVAGPDHEYEYEPEETNAISIVPVHNTSRHYP